jgi:hypothetical protein
MMTNPWHGKQAAAPLLGESAITPFTITASIGGSRLGTVSSLIVAIAAFDLG